MRLNFIMRAKNGSTSRGQGNYQAATITLQLIKDLVSQEGQCPLCYGTVQTAPWEAVPESGLSADQSSLTEVLSCESGSLQWTEGNLNATLQNGPLLPRTHFS